MKKVSKPALGPDQGLSDPSPALPRRSAMIRTATAWIGREASVLDPGYFALVMATGIVSNALFLEGERALSDVLFVVNLVAYPWLGLLTALRAARFGAAIWTDLINPRRVFLFFTTIAATDVFAMSLGLRGFDAIGLILWLAAAALWLALVYFGFGVLMLRNSAEDADVVEGAWLNAIVGTQSLVIVGAALAVPTGKLAAQAAIVLDLLWLIGLFLYGIFSALLAYRIFFADLKPDDVAPPLWIVMGAAAISANAGALLIGHGGTTPYLRTLQPFLDGVTLGVWAWASWWIPLLLLLGIWKHGVHRVPIVYTPLLWSMVFPLGMYAVATLRLARIADVAVLAAWSAVMAWIALAVWAATAIGLIAVLARRAGACMLQPP